VGWAPLLPILFLVFSLGLVSQKFEDKIHFSNNQMSEGGWWPPGSTVN
jgi:hypothetical protein